MVVQCALSSPQYHNITIKYLINFVFSDEQDTHTIPFTVNHVFSVPLRLVYLHHLTCEAIQTIQVFTASYQPVLSLETQRLMRNNLEQSFQSHTHTHTHACTHSCSLTSISGQKTLSGRFFPYLQLPVHRKWLTIESCHSIPWSAMCSLSILEWKKKILKVTEKTAFFFFIEEKLFYLERL